MRYYYKNIEVDKPEEFFKAIELGYEIQCILYSPKKEIVFFNYFIKHYKERDIAKFCYAYFKYCGKSCEHDDIKSFQIFNYLAKKDFTPAWFFLGECYFYGYGIEKSLKKAIACYIKAAQDGYSNACMALGDMYDKGDFIQKDLQKSVDYYKKAASGAIQEFIKFEIKRLSGLPTPFIIETKKVPTFARI